MTGPEHYQRAEDLIGDAAGASESSDHGRAAALVAIAQVHATLAAAAAAALNHGGRGLDERDYTAWYEAAGVKPDRPS
jgi:hypothetical protein